MASGKIEKQVVITLKLTIEEARFLHAICQNPIPRTEGKEAEQETYIRADIWNTLNEYKQEWSR